MLMTLHICETIVPTECRASPDFGSMFPEGKVFIMQILSVLFIFDMEFSLRAFTHPLQIQIIQSIHKYNEGLLSDAALISSSQCDPCILYDPVLLV